MIDTSYDVRTDVRPGADPDKYSKTLRRFHKALWSKDLPSGKNFELSDNQPGKYLYHLSELGEFSLASDGITHSLIYVKRCEKIIGQLSEDRLSKILSGLYTVPGFILFPGNQINGKITMNAARGFNARIGDRFDLTLECIKRFYVSEKSPLFEVIDRYSDFFNLFESFDGYLKFFLLQDLWDEKQQRIKFFLPFDDSFPTQPFPKDLTEYEIFIQKQFEFVAGRSSRMLEFSKTHLPSSV